VGTWQHERCFADVFVQFVLLYKQHAPIQGPHRPTGSGSPVSGMDRDSWAKELKAAQRKNSSQRFTPMQPDQATVFIRSAELFRDRALGEAFDLVEKIHGSGGRSGKGLTQSLPSPPASKPRRHPPYHLERTRPAETTIGTRGETLHTGRHRGRVRQPEETLGPS
jgi:hypothetical protein